MDPGQILVNSVEKPAWEAHTYVAGITICSGNNNILAFHFLRCSTGRSLQFTAAPRSSLTMTIDLLSLKQQLQLLGHQLPDEQIVAILKDMNIDFDQPAPQGIKPGRILA